MTKNEEKIIKEQIGCNLKSIRIFRKLSKSNLAEYMNVSVEQLQRYEKGTDLISSVRLYQLSSILDVPFAAFYQGIYVRCLF